MPNLQYSTDHIAVGSWLITTILGIKTWTFEILQDKALATTNLNETYDVKSIMYFCFKIKLDVFEATMDNVDDPELSVTPYEGALAMQDIYP